MSGIDSSSGLDSAKSAGVSGGCGNGYLDKENVDVLAVLCSDRYNPSALLVVNRNGAGLRFVVLLGRGRRLIELKCLEISASMRPT